MAELFFKHEVIYDTKNSSSVSDVANSLLANERLIRYAVMILEDCIEGATFDSVDIRLKEVTQNSPLAESLMVAIFVAYQSDLTREVPLFIRDVLGVSVPDKYKTIVTVLVMAIGLYGVSAAAKMISSFKETKNIDQDYKNFTYIAGDYISISPNRIEHAIQERFSGPMKQQVQKAGIDFFKPARREGVGILGPLGLKISAEAVLESPTDVDLSVEDELDSYQLRNVLIEIRALDKDRKKQGWFAVVQDVSKKRIKMQVDPSIDPNGIYGRDVIVGDIIVVNKKNLDGEYQPHLYHLVRLRES